MDKLIIEPTPLTPEIRFVPQEGIFLISGSSRPEDVRTFFEPILQWLGEFKQNVLDTKKVTYTASSPLVLKMKLHYFNSSSAKYIFDVLQLANQFNLDGHSIRIDWYYLDEDEDMLDAGKELADLLEMDFNFIEQKS